MHTLAPASRRRRWPVYALLVLGALFIAVGSFVGWLLLDKTRLRIALETSITALSDRPFHIDGEFDINLGRITTISGTDIRWLNPAWSKQPDMLTVKTLSLSLDLWSLLDGPIVVSSARAEDARLLFEWTDKGQFNWDIAVSPDKADDQSNPLRLILSRTELRNVEIRVRHPALTDELLIHVEQASQQHDAQDMLLITSAAEVSGRPLKVQGRVGPFAELIAGGTIDYNFDLGAPNVRLTANGHFDRLIAPQAPRLDLELVAADAGEVLRVLELPELTKGKIALQARIAPVEERLDGELKGSFGEFEINAKLTTKDISSFDEFSLTVSSHGPTAGSIGRLAGLDGLPDKPYALSVDARRDAKHLQVKQLSFTTTGLALEASGVARKLPELRDFDADFALSAESAQTVGKLFAVAWLPALPLKIKGGIRNGAGRNDALLGQITLGNISGELSGELTDKNDFAGSTFSYRGGSPDLRELARARGISLPVAVPARLETDLTLQRERLRITRLAADIADNHLTAQGTIHFGRAGSTLELEPQITGSDLGSLARLFLGDQKAAYFPGGNYGLTAKVAVKGSRVTIGSKDARVGNNVFGFDGTVGLAAESPQVNARITASGKNLAELLKPQFIKDVPAAAFSLRTALQLSDQGTVLDDLRFTLADSKLTGRLSTGWPHRPEQLEFDLTAAGSDLQASLPEIPGYVAAPVSFQVEAKGKAIQTKVEIERLEGRLADARIALTGKVMFKPNFSADAVRLSAAGPKLSDLGHVKGWPLLDLPFAIGGTMTGSEQGVRMDDFQARLGDSDLEGSMSISTAARPSVDLNVRSDALRLDQLLAHREAAQNGRRNKLLSSEPLHLEALKSFDGKLIASLGNVVSEDRELRRVLADASLKDGLLIVKQLQADARHGTLQSSFQVDARGKQPLLKGSLKATDLVFAVRGMSAEDHDRLPHLYLDSGFSASGNSASSLAAGVNGYFWLRAAKGRTPSLELGELYGDFASLLIKTLNPFAKKNPYTNLSCGGIYFEARNGQVKTAPAVVFQTDKLSIISRGSIDLRSEGIDFVFKTTPLQGVGLSAGDIINPFIKLGGTLQTPVLRLDVQSAAIEGGVAAATAGLSILASSLWDRWIGSSDACEKVREEARKMRRASNPADLPDS